MKNTKSKTVKNSYPKTRLLAHIYVGLCAVSLLLVSIGADIWYLPPGACAPMWATWFLNEDIVFISILFPVFGLMVFPLLLVASYIMLIAAKRPVMFLVTVWFDVMYRSYLLAYFIKTGTETGALLLWCLGIAVNIALDTLLLVTSARENKSGS